MKKLSLYIFLVLMWCNNVYAFKLNLECGSDEERLYVKIDRKTIEVAEPSKGNKIKFEVSTFDDFTIEAVSRGLHKDTTNYDTHLRVWEGWDLDKYIRDHLYTIQFERVKGYFGFYRSTLPWTKKKKKYTYNRLWELPCKKLDKKF